MNSTSMNERAIEAPLVSIIVPLYNVAPYLAETLDSIAAQSLTSWEAVLVDDGSEDESASIAAAYVRRDGRFRLFRQKNAGPSSARNTGLRYSNPTSRYITFLDGDDLWTTDAVDVMVSAAKSGSPGTIGAHAVGRHVDEQGQPIHPGVLEAICSRRPTLQQGRLVPSSKGQPTTFACLAVANCMPTGTLLFERSAMPELEPFRDDIRIAEDWYVWIRISLRGNFSFVGEVIFSYRRHGSNSSRSSRKMVMGYVDALDALITGNELGKAHRKLLIASQPVSVLLLMTLRYARSLHFGRAARFAFQSAINLWRFKLAKKIRR